MSARQTLVTATFAVGVLLSGLSGPALAEKGYYRWTDVNGNQHHSDRPPPSGYDYEFVSTESGLRRQVIASDAEEGTAPPQTWEEPEAPEPNVAEQQAAVEKNPAYCDQARANLDTLNSKARIRLRNPDGEITYLSGEQKEVERQKALDMISIHCN